MQHQAPIPRKPRPRLRRPAGGGLWPGLGMLIGLLLTNPATAQDDPQDRRELTQRLFDPPVVRLADENSVVRAGVLRAVGTSEPQREQVVRWLTDRGVVILRDDLPGLKLHFYAQGIEAMTYTDRLWEGLPRRADTLQGLIDHAITRARAERKAISTLIITGHAGLPGCAALGGTLDDCVFEGKLTDYQQRQLVRLRPYLAADAMIELRQCVTGSGEEGQRLLTAIHEVTGAAAVSYLADFHFGDSDNHPRIHLDNTGVRFISPEKAR